MIESSDPLRSWIPMSDLSFGRWKKGRPSCGNIVPAISQGRMQGPYYVYSSKVSQKRWISMVQWLTTGSFTQKPTSHKAVVFVFPPWIRGKAPTHATTNVSWSNTNIHHIWNLHGKHVKLLPTIHIFTYGQGLSGFCLQAFISFASRHLDLGLCRTFWIGWIHPVNFQSWPLEESIFPLSNYVIYDVIYIYIYYVYFPLSITLNLQSTATARAASAQPRHHRWHTMVRHHKPATSIHTTAGSFWASCLATEYTTGWNTQPQYLDINVEA